MVFVSATGTTTEYYSGTFYAQVVKPEDGKWKLTLYAGLASDNFDFDYTIIGDMNLWFSLNVKHNYLGIYYIHHEMADIVSSANGYEVTDFVDICIDTEKHTKTIKAFDGSQSRAEINEWMDSLMKTCQGNVNKALFKRSSLKNADFALKSFRAWGMFDSLV